MTPDHTKECNHIALLPKIPSKDDLLVLRKGLRKMKLPEICNGFNGSNDRLGSFVAISEKDNSVSFKWNIFGSDKKTVLFDDLCHKPELELGYTYLITIFYVIKSSSKGCYEHI